MQSNELITLGEILELSTGTITVRTKLQEIVSDSEFIVLQPTVKGIPVRPESEEVLFTFYRADGCYSFRARLSHSFLSGELNLCRVRRVSQITRTQRRECYRLPIVLDVMLYESQQEDEEPAKRYHGKTINLSEKGMELSSFTTFDKGAKLTAQIRLPSCETLTVQATLLNSSPPLKRTEPNKLVLLFIDHDEKDQAYIRRFILKQQVLARKRNEP